MVAVVEVANLMEMRVRARIAGKLFPRLFRKTRPPTGWQSEAVWIRIRLVLDAIRASSTSDDDYSTASTMHRAVLNERIINRIDRTIIEPLYLLYFNFDPYLNTILGF